MAAKIRGVSAFKLINKCQISRVQLTLCFSDKDFANFEFAHFLTGTHVDEEQTAPNCINELKVRLPKIDKTEKSTIDYDKLDRNAHSKVQIVSSIEHEGEVMKCRQNPFDDQCVASVLTSGVVNIYKKGGNGTLVGKLQGLGDETFCLDWNKKKQGHIISAVKNTVCVWDVEKNLSGGQLFKIDNAHGESDVNDAKFSPLNENLILTSGGDGHYRM